MGTVTSDKSDSFNSPWLMTDAHMRAELESRVNHISVLSNPFRIEGRLCKKTASFSIPHLHITQNSFPQKAFQLGHDAHSYRVTPVVLTVDFNGDQMGHQNII